jgi:hypothetical protein
MIATATRNDVEAELGLCADDPVRFAVRLLGWSQPDCSALTSYQEELVALVAAHKVTFVPAGHSVGKSRTAALIALWWLWTRRPSLVLVVAPSAWLVGSVIFKELRKAIRGARIRLGGRITESPKAAPQVYEIGDGWACYGVATNMVERVQGQHAEHLLAIIDEASGVPDEIIEGIVSWNYEKFCMFGNPLRHTGQFRQFFDRSREPEEREVPAAERTVSMVISSLDSPHKDLDKSPCGLADRRFLDEVARVYGRDSRYWLLHIDLDKTNPFPTEDHTALLPDEWVDRLPRVQRQVGGARVLACDISKGTGRDRFVALIGDRGGIHFVHQSSTTAIPEAARVIRDLSVQFGVRQDFIIYDAGGWAGTDLERY